MIDTSADARLHASWPRCAEFVELLADATDRTPLGAESLFVLHRLTRQCSQLGGAIAEVGVDRGGSALVLARSRERAVPLHLFETPGQRDGGDGVEVARLFAGAADVQLHRGLFPATAFPLLRQQFCLVHCAAGSRSAIRDCCSTFYCRLLRGGALLIEGYGNEATPGVTAAVDAFFADKAEVPLPLATGQALAIKL